MDAERSRAPSRTAQRLPGPVSLPLRPAASVFRTCPQRRGGGLPESWGFPGLWSHPAQARLSPEGADKQGGPRQRARKLIDSFNKHCRVAFSSKRFLGPGRR